MHFSDRITTSWRALAQRLQVPANGKWLALTVFGGVALAAGIVAAACCDPTKQPFFPKCLFHSLTGLDCPGCGTARAIHAMAHGDLRTAFRYNAILFAAIPLLGVLVARPQWARRPAVAWGVLVTAIGWMIVRNLVWPS